MRLLLVVLRWQAVLWAVSGAALVVAPGWVTETLLDQPPLGDEAWLRLLGIAALAIAAQIVLVARRIEDLWWWSWTFALLEAGTALVLLLNALFGLPDDAAAWPWWALGLLNAGVAALQVTGLAKAGTERSPA